MVRIRPSSPMTMPVPSRSWPSVAALRASGTARTSTLTIALKSFSASGSAAAVVAADGGGSAACAGLPSSAVASAKASAAASDAGAG